MASRAVTGHITAICNFGACANYRYLVEYFKFHTDISNFEISSMDLYEISERDDPLVGFKPYQILFSPYPMTEKKSGLATRD